MLQRKSDVSKKRSGFTLALLALWALWSLSACKAEVSLVEFAIKGPVITYSLDSQPLPALVFRAENGDRIKEAPPIKFSVYPEDVIELIDGRIQPVGNGNANVSAKVLERDLEATLPVTVQLVRKIVMQCQPASCQGKPGDHLKLSADAISKGIPVVGAPLKWTIENEEIATLEAPGRVRLIKAGMTHVLTSLGKVRGKHVVRGVDPIDELVVRCPDPEITYSFHRAKGSVAPKVACKVRVGRRIQLSADVLASGKPSPVREPNWRVGDLALARVSGGVVYGMGVGATVVEARLDDLIVRIPIEVSRR